jgi:hypothetical protein
MVWTSKATAPIVRCDDRSQRPSRARSIRGLFFPKGSQNGVKEESKPEKRAHIDHQIYDVDGDELPPDRGFKEIQRQTQTSRVDGTPISIDCRIPVPTEVGIANIKVRNPIGDHRVTNKPGPGPRRAQGNPADTISRLIPVPLNHSWLCISSQPESRKPLIIAHNNGRNLAGIGHCCANTSGEKEVCSAASPKQLVENSVSKPI